MPQKRPFHQLLKERRLSQALDRAELAKCVGCSVAMLSSLEQGVRRPSREMAERLAHFLAIPPEEREAFLRAARTPLAETPQPAAAGTGEGLEAASLPSTPPGDPTATIPQSAEPLLAYLGQLIGREVELQQLKEQLLRPSARIVTLIGPGGVGKTHLALRLAGELAPHFPAGVGFVALANQTDPARLPAAILEELRLLAGQAAPSLEQLVDVLRERELLLVLDNFEHLVAGAPLLSQLLSACPRLKLLVTSRFALQLHSEIVFSLAPLACPARDSAPPAAAQLADWAARFGAIQLFVSRAQMASARFQLTPANVLVVAEICRRLEGLPLAIILAAARLRGLAPAQLLARLDERLLFLATGGVDLPARQQTLQGLIDWSYDLLDPAEQAVFVQLAVFVGRWTLEEAEAICVNPAPERAELMDMVLSLLNKSLLQEQPDDEQSSFQMLTLLREYALQRLSTQGDEQTLRQRHARYYLELVEQAEPALTRQEQQRWLNRLAACHDNLRAALAWLLEQGDAEGALRFASAVWKFWQFRYFLDEGRRWLAAALELDRRQGRPDSVLRSKAAWAAGWLSNDLTKVDAAQAYFEASLAAGRAVGDPRSIGLALQGVGQVALRYKDYPRATSCFQEAIQIFVQLGDREELTWSRNHLAQVLFRQGAHQRSLALLQESLADFAALGHRWGRLLILEHIGRVHVAQGRYEQARTIFEQVQALALELGDQRHVAEMSGGIGATYMEQGAYEQAQPLLHASLGNLRILKANNLRWVLLAWGRMLLAVKSDYAAALESFDEARRLAAEEHDTWFEGPTLFYQAASAWLLGRPEQALLLFHEGLQLARGDRDWATIICAAEMLAVTVADKATLAEHHVLAATALGLASQLRAQVERPRGAPERDLYARAYRLACAALGREQVDALLGQQQRTLESAGALALLQRLLEALRAQP